MGGRNVSEIFLFFFGMFVIMLCCCCCCCFGKECHRFGGFFFFLGGGGGLKRGGRGLVVEGERKVGRVWCEGWVEFSKGEGGGRRGEVFFQVGKKGIEIRIGIGRGEEI